MTLLLAIAQPAEPAPEAMLDCSYDLEVMLELDQQAFDQDFEGGWRVLQNRGCYAEAYSTHACSGLPAES